MARLISKPDIGLAQDEAAKGLIPALNEMLRALPDLPQALPIPDAFQTATAQFWWADDSLAGFNRSCVDSAIALIREYNEFPTGIGSAWDREKFCEQSNLKKRIQDAVTELEKVKS